MLDTWDETDFAQAAGWLTGDSAAAADAAALINDRLEGLRFSSADSLTALRPAVLEPGLREDVSAAARRLVEVIQRYCWNLTDYPRELARLCGMTPHQQPFLGALAPRMERDLAGCNARPDALIRNGVPVFIEANFGAANSSPITTNALLPVYEELYGVVPTVSAMELREPFAARAELYSRICKDYGFDRRILIVGTVAEPEISSPRYFQCEADYMSRCGFESEYVELDFFSSPRGRQASSRGAVAQKHFLPEELKSLGLHAPWADLRRAHENMAWIVPDSGLSLSSKVVFAWLSKNSALLDADDAEFIEKHIPWTRFLDGGEIDFGGRVADPVELLIDFQEDMVLKPTTSFAGQGVLVGAATRAEVWREAVRGAARSGTHIVQELVRPDELVMDFYDASTKGVLRSSVSYVLGPYVVDGISAGCSVRHTVAADSGVVNHIRGASINIVL
ncbi:hypothetical protein [Kitasatospora sp. MAP5-34]|uniref:hypothetical protein n=1 Tax=Kitasatospora sp. MAP5-34 TaxID=3035102 RepID=UPI002472F5E0|nr:hypothetical protein [Kitasatospora sp. MAP5-34]MDH6578177.1 hypothetical protein [Kitasatospora sp. MAP5-34]